MSDATRSCVCGRELEAEETKCPSCVRADESWWKQAAAIALPILGGLGSIAVVVLTGGKVRPKV